jgi:hypothetical protein
VWLNEYKTLNDARRRIGGYVDRYHHRPHSGLNYRTPLEVRQTCEELKETAASRVNAGGSRVTGVGHCRVGNTNSDACSATHFGVFIRKARVGYDAG